MKVNEGLDMKHEKPKSATYTVTEAAALIGIGRNAAYDGIKAGDIPSIRVGGSIRVPVAALHRMLGMDTGKAA